MAIDPVCKMDVEEGGAQHRLEYQGKTYYFCSAACRNAFEKSPGKYLKEKPWWKFW
ncbi:MAG: YHS domain-containing protein [Candidatus Methanoperedens sp.]|nr:YHS domain-containing protein [Candidatus Methanoperedens sp.]MCZ7406399.1 YHS domain-containing protein [Candidatus Methanoperedens sp.]MDD5472640.1 YHS domain-containing protein [Candidatus Methanoperedens sp.]